jgi:hypothetical protein
MLVCSREQLVKRAGIGRTGMIGPCRAGRGWLA